MIFRFLLAAFVGFFYSLVTGGILVAFGVQCDAYSRVAAIWFCVFPAIALVTAFIGVFTGTLCLPFPFRKDGSKYLFFLGLACSLPLCLAPRLFLYFPFLALGGFGGVFLFRRLGLEPSETILSKLRLRFISLGVFCLVVLFTALLAFGGASVPLTKEKATVLFGKAGGLEKVNQEAALLSARTGTNEMFFFGGLNETNYPALSVLGRPVTYYDGDFMPPVEIRFGTHFHPKSIFIFPLKHGIVQTSTYRSLASEMDSSKYIQMTNNIFITK